MPPHSLTNFEIQKYYQNKLSMSGQSTITAGEGTFRAGQDF